MAALLYKTHLLHGNENQIYFYKKYLNILTKVKAASKKAYYQQEFNINRNNPRKTWELINSALPGNQPSKTKTKVDRLIIDDEEITVSSAIAEKFNQHFASIGKNLADKIQNNDNNKFSKYLSQRSSSSMYLEPPRYNEVYNLIHSLGLHKSSGHDNIHSYYIQIACDAITPYLTHFYQLSFEFGIFPDCLKIAKIIPIFKAGSKSNLNNYRPISLLTNFSKILEKLICSRLTKFLNKNKIIHSNQYGFRQNSSTTHAMLDIMCKINNNMNEKKFTGLISLDPKKAFDTVSHDILLQKLHHYGVRGLAHNLFNSYLTRRKQYVYLNGCHSSTIPMQFGVPQGSNLGHIFFSIYVNDIFGNFEFAPVLYADDTCLYINTLKEEKLQMLMNREVEKAHLWMKANKLTINPDKSSALVISPGAKTKSQKPEVLCDGRKIAVNKTVKYLGLWIDENLKFDTHIKSVERKIACAVGILCKLKWYLPQNILLQLYHTLIYPHLLYAIPVWGSTYKSYLHYISIFQNKAVKIITGTKPDTSANPSYTNLKILKFHELYQFEVAKIMHILYHKQHPTNLNQYFTKSCLRHSHRTRNSTSLLFTVPLTKSTKLQQSFLYQGVKIWNSIPQTIKTSSFHAFKSDCKEFLINASYKVQSV